MPEEYYSAYSWKENPFQSRWRLDDPEWVKKRKQQWKELKVKLERDGLTKKQIKYYRTFWLEGYPPPYSLGGAEIRFSKFDWFSYTPCESEEHVWKLVSELVDVSYTASVILKIAAFGTGGREPFGISGGQEGVQAKALIPDTYEEKKIRTNRTNKEKYVDFFIPAQDFVTHYERGWYGFLSSQLGYANCPIQFNFEHYLSCLKHLEWQQVVIEHAKEFRHALSLSYNFVEPRGSWGPDSTAKQFAKKIVERLGQDDIPKTLQEELRKLGTNHLIEYSRENPAPDKILCGGVTLGGERNAAGIRVLHGLEPIKSLRTIINAAQTVELLDANFKLVGPTPCDMAGWISEGFAETLGNGRQGVPAWRFAFWFEPKCRISNNEKAQFGADIYIPVPISNRQLEESTPSLIYSPRLSSAYKELYPSDIYFLKEREFRRAVFDSCGQHLLSYDDDEDFYAHLPDNFSMYQCKNMPYLVLSDRKFDNLKNALDGGDVSPWNGDDLPQINWNTDY